jgi:hypothetical protein
MRVLLATKTLMLVLLASAAVPHLILPLLKYPIAVLVSDLTQVMIGG